MKTRRILFIVIGSLLIFLNLLSHLEALITHAYRNLSVSYGIGYFIGSNIFLIIGVLFFRVANRLGRKIKIAEERSQIDQAIELIGR